MLTVCLALWIDAMVSMDSLRVSSLDQIGALLRTHTCRDHRSSRVPTDDAVKTTWKAAELRHTRLSSDSGVLSAVLAQPVTLVSCGCADSGAGASWQVEIGSVRARTHITNRRNIMANSHPHSACVYMDPRRCRFQYCAQRSRHVSKRRPNPEHLHSTPYTLHHTPRTLHPTH
jgi:hypothetical protein